MAAAKPPKEPPTTAAPPVLGRMLLADFKDKLGVPVMIARSRAKYIVVCVMMMIIAVCCWIRVGCC